MIIQPAPPPPPRRLNLIATGLALLTLIALGPAMFRFQTARLATVTQRSWRMADVLGQTQRQLVDRFGAPQSTKDYSLAEGSFAGHSIGQKHYYASKDPRNAQLLRDAPVIWAAPQYAAIREIIWKLPDSYLTVWLHQPQAEATLSGETMELTLPKSGPDEWVALDNYRVGKDLVETAK